MKHVAKNELAFTADCHCGVVESGSCRGAAVHQLHTRTSHRLHYAVHEPRHQHFVQATDGQYAQSLLVPFAAVVRDLDLNFGRLPRCQLCAVRRRTFQSVRVAQPTSMQRRLRRRAQSVYALQQLLVYRRLANATRSLCFFHCSRSCWSIVVYRRRI